MIGHRFDGGTIQHHPNASVLVVLHEEHNGPVEVGVEKNRRGNQQASGQSVHPGQSWQNWRA